MRMKFLRILPEMWARTSWPLGNATRNIVPGRTCVTVPLNSIGSSFATRQISQIPGCALCHLLRPMSITFLQSGRGRSFQRLQNVPIPVRNQASSALSGAWTPRRNAPLALELDAGPHDWGLLNWGIAWPLARSRMRPPNAGGAEPPRSRRPCSRGAASGAPRELE